MDKKTKILFYTLLHYLKIREVCVLKEGFSISTKIDDVLFDILPPLKRVGFLDAIV